MKWWNLWIDSISLSWRQNTRLTNLFHSSTVSDLVRMIVQWYNCYKNKYEYTWQAYTYVCSLKSCIINTAVIRIDMNIIHAKRTCGLKSCMYNTDRFEDVMSTYTLTASSRAVPTFSCAIQACWCWHAVSSIEPAYVCQLLVLDIELMHASLLLKWTNECKLMKKYSLVLPLVCTIIPYLKLFREFSEGSWFRSFRPTLENLLDVLFRLY